MNITHTPKRVIAAATAVGWASAVGPVLGLAAATRPGPQPEQLLGNRTNGGPGQPLPGERCSIGTRMSATPGIGCPFGGMGNVGQICLGMEATPPAAWSAPPATGPPSACPGL